MRSSRPLVCAAAVVAAALMVAAAGRVGDADGVPPQPFPGLAAGTAAVDPSPPASPVKLVFIHHSSGENWLSDDRGGLGLALRAAHYFVSDTNYGWGPADEDAGSDAIGDHTDLGHWYNWFVGPHHDTYLAALLAESEQHAEYSRLADDPGGVNRIVMFKSCFPNSNLGGEPDDAPTTGDNPLRGQDSSSEAMTVANAKGIYNDLLGTFSAHPETLFIAVTAPPLMASDTDPARAANARAFNTWLVTRWLAGYSGSNVAVIDFYNVLTSNGGGWNVNDIGASTGNHHRVRAGAIEYVTNQGGNTAAYPDGGGDNHPSTAGNQKATSELVPLINVAYNRWRSSAATTPTPSAVPTPTATPTRTFTPTRTPSVTPTARPTTAAATPRPVQRRLLRAQASSRLHASDFAYVGAFRLPDREDGAPDQATWEYGGQGMTYRPSGDLSGPDDGFPGSILATGFETESWVSEIDIPSPVASTAKNPDDLPVAHTLQPFTDVRGGLFEALTELPRVALAYLSLPLTGERVHLAWGQHFQESDEARLPSHAYFSPDLAGSRTVGAWWIGTQSLYSVNGYLFEIPRQWADDHVGGRYLATGRFRDGGWSGQGPSLFAYAPWLSGDPPPPGAHLVEVTLLQYSHTRGDDPTPDRYRLAGYQHADEWEGGAWITTSSGKAAVAFVGTKGTGSYYWYGWLDPSDPERPCVELAEGGMCFRADGAPCPSELVQECPGHTSDRGWWSSAFAAEILLYDADALAAVARGELAPGEPQPYEVVPIDGRLFLPDPGVEPMSAGTGRQRRYRVGEACFDRVRGHLFVLERFADGAKPVIHVWRVR